MNNNVIDSAPSNEKELPFPVEKLDPKVYDTYDDDQINDLLVEKLTLEGYDLANLVVTGFDAGEVLKNATFGDRDSTFAVSAIEMKNPDAEHSVVKYMVQNDYFKPAIAVYDATKLLGGIAELDRGELYESNSEQVKQDPSKFVYWATKNGESIDEATVKLFLFK